MSWKMKFLPKTKKKKKIMSGNFTLCSDEARMAGPEVFFLLYS